MSCTIFPFSVFSSATISRTPFPEKDSGGKIKPDFLPQDKPKNARKGSKWTYLFDLPLTESLVPATVELV